jgi:hypothetical protein
MIENRMERTPAGRTVLLMDSVSFLPDDARGIVVVTASHGGLSSGEYALKKRPDLIFFNDAGVGKNDAGIAALDVLNGAGIPAVAIGAGTARIGEVLDHWEHGRVSHANAVAAGIVPGMSVVEAVDAWIPRR